MSGPSLLSRRALLAALGAWAASPAAAGPLRPRPRPAAPAPDAGAGAEVEALIAEANLGGEVAFVVADAETGAVLATRQAGLALPPASTAKVITTLYALDRLGPDFRFVTDVSSTGPLAGGVLKGDLILEGGGDPVLQTDELGALVERLAAQGARKVEGRFLLYDRALPQITEIDANQPLEAGYNAAISGLNLNFNRVYFAWARGQGETVVKMSALGERFDPQVTSAQMELAARAAPLFTYRLGAGREEWTVAREGLSGEGSLWLPVRRPAAYVGDVFRALGTDMGLRLPKPEIATALPPGRQLLARHESAALPDLLKGMLKYSTNITAEALGLRASAAGGLAASGAAMGAWLAARLGLSAEFADHSGLGAASRISPEVMVQALVKARKAQGSLALLPGLLKDRGLRGEEETTSGPAGIRVPAKTGTLNFVSGLVGYIEPPAGRTLAFAIYMADLPRRAALPPEATEDPPGSRGWAKRARRLQAALLRDWAGRFL